VSAVLERNVFLLAVRTVGPIRLSDAVGFVRLGDIADCEVVEERE
jgi:hypothetical protein